MADRLWRVQVSIPMDSGVPEDAIVNTWHFDDDDDPQVSRPETGASIRDMLDAFYSSIAPNLFPSTIGTEFGLKCYDLTEAEPRQPAYVDSFDVPSTVNAPMVAEAALCLSFSAAQESGVPAARRRGRIFLGPLCTSVMETVNSAVRPKETVRQTIADAAAVLQAGHQHPLESTRRCRWSVFSPSTLRDGANIGEAFNDVLTGWVDDTFDTQRRRGPAPSSRITWP